jgi:hypothetical protein
LEPNNEAIGLAVLLAGIMAGISFAVAAFLALDDGQGRPRETPSLFFMTGTIFLGAVVAGGMYLVTTGSAMARDTITSAFVAFLAASVVALLYSLLRLMKIQGRNIESEILPIVLVVVAVATTLTVLYFFVTA